MAVKLSADIKVLISTLPEERQTPFAQLLQTILEDIPAGFDHKLAGETVHFVVPLSLYPAGYHCTPGEPLPFISLTSQKNFIALHHMGMYADKKLHDWFLAEYPKHCKYKLDMGKSCIRFKKMDDIPYALVGELVGKMTVQEWVKVYEQVFKKF